MQCPGKIKTQTRDQELNQELTYSVSGCKIAPITAKGRTPDPQLSYLMFHSVNESATEKGERSDKKNKIKSINTEVSESTHHTKEYNAE